MNDLTTITAQEFKQIVIDGVHYNYGISKDGMIFGYKRGKTLKIQTNNNGYMKIMLSMGTDDKYKTFYLHRLLMMTFNPTTDNSLQINHIDGDKRNNALSNLEWSTSKANLDHGKENGLIPQRTNKIAVTIDNGDETLSFDSVAKASKYLGCCHTAIHSVFKGYQKEVKGYKVWKSI